MLVGYISQVFFAVCLLPQVIKLFIAKTTKGVSWVMWFFQLFGYFFGLMYGFGLHEKPLILGNVWGIFCTFVFVYAFWQYKDQ